MQATRGALYILSSLLLLTNGVQGQDYKGLSDAYSDYFMLGTIYHGKQLGNDKVNPHIKKEYEITENEFNAITAENCMKPMHIIGKK